MSINPFDIATDSAVDILTSASLPKKGGSFLKELLHFALIIVFIVLPIRLFVAQPFVVVGSSMEPTFISNDYLIVDELTYHFQNPKRGDVIIFKYHGGAEDQKYFIKRIIGLPGETVDIRNGKVTITNAANPDGFILDETYVKDLPTNVMSVTLEEGKYFVMGDNRGVSFDSRTWGALSEDDIVGKAFLRLLPLSKVDIMPGSHANHYADERK